MISATPAAATPRPPLRAHEPQDPVLRAGLAAVRWKRGNPYCDRTTLRVAQRFAFGLDQARRRPRRGHGRGGHRGAPGPGRLRRGDRLLARHPRRELARVHGPAGEAVPAGPHQRAAGVGRRRRPVRPARADPGPRPGPGRWPSASGRRRSELRRRRRAPAPPGPPPLPNPGYDPLDALVQRSACGLRQAVVLEQAILTGATRQTGVAATMAAAARRWRSSAPPSLPRRARSRCGMACSRVLPPPCRSSPPRPPWPPARAEPGRPDAPAIIPGSAQSRLTVSERRRSLPPPGHLGGARSASGLRQGVSRSCQRACSSSS